MNKDQPEKGTQLNAVEIHDNILAPAEEEIQRPAASLFWSAFSAGLVIGFSFLGSAFATQQVSDSHRHVAAALAYPLGFIFVSLARSELFTENTLVPIIPLLEHRDRKSLHGLQRMWLLLLLGNLVGALLFALALARTAMVRPDLHSALERVASEAVSGGFGQVLYAGVFAGWLIALMTWLLAATRFTGAQIALIWLCTAPISAFGFRHSIAGSVDAFYLAARGLGPWGGLLGNFIVPAVLGNAIGGVLLVALLNYGQVAPEKAEKR
jgi:formate/nitrite transporter FocA (FNT family)